MLLYIKIEIFFYSLHSFCINKKSLEITMSAATEKRNTFDIWMKFEIMKSYCTGKCHKKRNMCCNSTYFQIHTLTGTHGELNKTHTHGYGKPIVRNSSHGNHKINRLYCRCMIQSWDFAICGDYSLACSWRNLNANHHINICNEHSFCDITITISALRKAAARKFERMKLISFTAAAAMTPNLFVHLLTTIDSNRTEQNRIYIIHV